MKIACKKCGTKNDQGSAILMELARCKLCREKLEGAPLEKTQNHIPRPEFAKAKPAAPEPHVEEPTPYTTRAIRSMIKEVVATAGSETPMWDEQNDAATQPLAFGIEERMAAVQGIADLEPEPPHEDTFGLLQIDPEIRGADPLGERVLTTELMIPRASRVSSIKELAKDLHGENGFADRGAQTGRVSRTASKRGWLAKKWPVASIFGACAVVLALAVATACTAHPSTPDVKVAKAVQKPAAAPHAPAGKLAPAAEAPKDDPSIPVYRVEDLPVSTDAPPDPQG